MLEVDVGVTVRPSEVAETGGHIVSPPSGRYLVKQKTRFDDNKKLICITLYTVDDIIFGIQQ